MKKTGRRLLSFLLALGLLTAAIPLAAAENAVLPVAVMSDLHVYSAADLPPLIPPAEDSLFFHATIQGQMEYESEAIFRAALDAFTVSDRQILLLPGDLTGGSLVSHRAVASLLAEVEKTGKKVFVINGNHDIDPDNAQKATAADFSAIYADFGFAEALARDEASLSYTADLGSGYRLLAIDSCIYGENTGEIGNATLAWLLAQCKTAAADGVTMLAMQHHGLVQHFANQSLLGADQLVKNYASIAVQLADAGVRWCFTGHFHANDISSAVSPRGNMLYDIMTGALPVAPCAYRYVDFSQGAATVATHYVCELDPAFLPESMTAAQRDAIAADFPAYAEGFFEAGMSRWVWRYIGSTAKINKWLHIEEGSALDRLTSAVMPLLGEALTLPLYADSAAPGAPSVEKYAAQAHMELPAGEYKDFPALLAKIVGALYRGDENIPWDRTEVTLVRLCLRAALTHALLQLGDRTLPAAVIGELTGTPLSEQAAEALSLYMMSEKCATLCIAAMEIPLVEGFTRDAYAPADCNCTLAAEPVQPAAPTTLLQKICAFFRLWIAAYKRYMEILIK